MVVDQALLDKEGPVVASIEAAEENILLKVKRKILEEPENFGMDNFAGRPEDCGVKQPDKNTCGTAHCIGGWVIFLKTGEAFPAAWKFNIDTQASNMIGLPFKSRYGEPSPHPLFYLTDWPDELSAAYAAASTNEEAANIAAAAIDRYLSDPKNFGK